MTWGCASRGDLRYPEKVKRTFLPSLVINRFPRKLLPVSSLLMLARPRCLALFIVFTEKRNQSNDFGS